MAIRNKIGYQAITKDFIKEVYVVCPSCHGQAIVKTPGYSLKNDFEKDVKLVCPGCGYNKLYREKPGDTEVLRPGEKIQVRTYVIDSPCDPFFHLPIWLTTECCEKMLWAYNYEHLSFLRNFIEAGLRERNGQPLRNGSTGSRLPAWMTSARNRETVLKTIDQLSKK